MKLDEKSQAIYKRREENKMYKASLLYTAKVEGEERGRKKEKIEIAKNLLKARMDVVFISNTTGLSIEEIEELR